jgi:cytochrome P450
MLESAATAEALVDFHPFGQAFRADPLSFYPHLLAHSPLPIEVEGKPALVVSRYRQAKSMLSFYKDFSSAKPPGTPGMERVDFFNSRPVMNYSDPPEHTQLRKIVAPAFSPRVLEVLKARAQAIADQLLDGLGPEFDGVADLGYPFSMRLLLNSFMGVPPDEEHIFIEYLRTIPLLDQIPPGGGKPQAYLDAWQRGAEYCDVALDRARKGQTDNLVRLIADASDSGTISKDDVMATMVVLFAGGLTTVAATVGTSLLRLAENPDVAERIRRDPSLATRHFEETLRHFPAVAQVMRFPTHDLEFEGLAIAKYTPIYVILAAACHDPEEFPDPYGFDIDRPNNKDHLGFSAGIHTCIGNVIARAVMPPLIADVARRFPRLRLTDPDAPLTFDHGNPRVRHLTGVRLSA